MGASQGSSSSKRCASARTPTTAAGAQRSVGPLPLCRTTSHKPTRCLLQKNSRKCFDSADWALSKGGNAVELPAEQHMDSLPVRIQPPTTPVMPRRLSNLGGS